MFNQELNMNYKLFAPISCIPQAKLSKRDLKDYPFIPDLQSLSLDALGETLIN